MLYLILCIELIWSAPRPTSFPTEVPYTHVKRLIQLDGKEESLKSLGPQAYVHLREIMFRPEESVDDRWKATLTVAKIGGRESLPDLELALASTQWFMRSAGLLGVSVVEREKSLSKAKTFLHSDPALLVRATALQVIAQNKKIDKSFLWSEVYNPLNFNNGKSLPIRLSILRVLENSLTTADTAKLNALLRENNKEIQSFAKTALNKLNM